MRAISLQQPWALMAVLGIKTVETRPRATDYRGLLYIHASQSIKTDSYEQYARNPELRRWVHEAFVRTGELVASHSFVTENFVIPRKVFKSFFYMGSIIGHVTVTDCDEAFALKKKFNKSHRYEDWEREWAVGDLSSDRFGYTLINPVMFETPIPAKGTIAPILWDCSKYLDNRSEILNTLTHG